MLDHFSRSELACPTTGEVRLASGFGEALEQLRIKFDAPIYLTSACRSPTPLVYKKPTAFDLQLVRRGIGPKALKRGTLMARSKNRVLGVDPDGRLITVQVQLENGEVVIGHYKAVVWLQPPADALAEARQAMSQPPVATYGTRRSSK